jgi:hypothetical protein
MRSDFSLIVEGKEDIRFLEDFISYHFNHSVIRSNFIKVNGKSESLHKATVDIQKSSVNKLNILIFDADDIDYNSTITNITNKSKELALKFDSIFLFPNNQEKGNLETLLKKSVETGNEKLFDCIEDYVKCRDKIGLKNKNHIDEKEKLYIYHGSFKDSGKAKGSEREYLNKDIWDLDSPHLQPLKEFLRKELF